MEVVSRGTKRTQDRGGNFCFKVRASKKNRSQSLEISRDASLEFESLENRIDCNERHNTTVFAMAEPASTSMAEEPEARIPPEPQLETESLVTGTQPEQTSMIPPFETQTQGGSITDGQIEQSDMYMSGATVNTFIHFIHFI